MCSSVWFEYHKRIGGKNERNNITSYRVCASNDSERFLPACRAGGQVQRRRKGGK